MKGTSRPTGYLSSHSSPHSTKTSIKCVVVGDWNIGKTSMMVTYTTDTFPGEHVPTVFDSYWAVILREGRPVTLGLLDTAGQPDGDASRPLFYPGTDVFLVCFSVDNPQSLSNVISKWYPEVRHHCPNVPVILVGTKADLRACRVRGHADAYAACDSEVLYTHGVMAANEIAASSYMECSSKTRQGLSDVFDAVVSIALKMGHVPDKPEKQDICCTLV